MTQFNTKKIWIPKRQPTTQQPFKEERPKSHKMSATPPKKKTTQRWVPKVILQAQLASSQKWIPKLNQPNRRGGVSHKNNNPPSHPKQTPQMVWQPKTSTTPANRYPTTLTKTTNPYDKINMETRYDFQTLERTSAQASTADAHGSHCSMTHSTCTASFPLALKHSEVVGVRVLTLHRH